MAKIYPKFETNFNGSYGEKRVFEAFEQLPDDWYIFHSIKWSEKRRSGNVTWGEADFLVVNRRFGMLVLEVKSGLISCKDGIFHQKRIDGGEAFEIFPFEQADRSKYKLLAELKKRNLANRCFIDKAVWFPSISDDFSNVNLPLEYKKELILSANDLQEPLEAMERVFNYYNASNYTLLSEKDMDTLIEMLVPCFDLVPAYNATKNEINDHFYQLTMEQKKILDFIEDEDSVAICGTAGTGKTMIAVEQANRLSAKGNKVLYLCFNRKLIDYLEENRCELNVDYYSIHQFLYRKGFLLDDFKINIEGFSEYYFKDDEYDYLIIDEAQDLGDEILEQIVNKAKEEKIGILLFYDKNQLIINNRMPEILNSFDCKLSLKKNCRNTIRIMETVNNSIGIDPNPSYLSVNGEIPVLHCANSEQVAIKGIEDKILEYIKKGYSASDITIVTMQTESNSILSDIKTLANHNISNARNDDGILFTSVRKFKGLESDCIIVVDYDPRKNEEEYLRLFYVASSRARQKLDVFTVIDGEELEALGKKAGGPFSPMLNLANSLKMKIEELTKTI